MKQRGGASYDQREPGDQRERGTSGFTHAREERIGIGVVVITPQHEREQDRR